MPSFTIFIFLTVLSASVILSGCKSKIQTTNISLNSNEGTVAKSSSSPAVRQSFENIKTPHFVSSTPANNASLLGTPSEVVINFNFNLASNSKISVSTNNQEVTTSKEIKIAADKLSMSALINAAGAGPYNVSYTACWPDGSCHEGSFGFTVTK